MRQALGVGRLQALTISSFRSPSVVTFALPLKLFTGTAGGPPAPSTARFDDLAKYSTSNVLFALRAHGGRAARGPSEELEWSSAG